MMRNPVGVMLTLVVLLVGAACSSSRSSIAVSGRPGAAGSLAEASGALASPSAAPFQVLSSTLFREADDTLELDGEVRNNTAGAAGEIIVHLQLFDGQQKPLPLSSPDTDASRNLTPPGEVSAFVFLLPHGKQLQRQVAAYRLTAEGRPPGSQPLAGLQVSGEVATTTPQGDYVLTGQLANMGSAPIPSPELLATFYDASGRVVRVDRFVFAKDVFAVGEGDEFSITISGGGTLGIARYVLVPQSGA